MIETLRQRIMRHEGFCEFPKYDAKGMWVVGYGHDIPEEKIKDYQHGITADEAGDLLTDDIQKATTAVLSRCAWAEDLSEARRDVLIEMVFQMGINGLLQFKNMLYHARSGDVDGVAESMRASKWHSQTPERCEELARIYINDGVD